MASLTSTTTVYVMLVCVLFRCIYCHSVNLSCTNNTILFQWIASMVGVVFVGASVFSFIAIMKKDEKFEKEVKNIINLFTGKY